LEHWFTSKITAAFVVVSPSNPPSSKSQCLQKIRERKMRVMPTLKIVEGTAICCETITLVFRASSEEGYKVNANSSAIYHIMSIYSSIIHLRKATL
jgi:hypothetical protein